LAQVNGTPPLLDRAELERRSVDACRKHVEATLEGEYAVDPLEHALEWDPIALAHVFDQPLVVWRALSAFEVLVDGEDRPVGFVDEDKWLRCAWEELPRDEAVGLARATGFVPPEARLLSSGRGEKDCLELVFAERPGARAAVRVRINAPRRAVISVEPLAETAA
jgi:hypothetical protein